MECKNKCGAKFVSNGLGCVECDVCGFTMRSTEYGIKHDTNKPRMDLLPFDALAEVARVMGVGAEKYGDDNWRLVEPATRYEAALLRHYAAYKSGEVNDPETGLPHLAHMATNALFILARSKK